MIIKRAPIAIIVALLAMPALAQEGDIAKGEKVYKKCSACHMIGEGARNRLGPHLNGIIDNPAGAVAGFRYSPAMQAAAEGGLVWDGESLADFLTRPREFMKGHRMVFPGLRKAADVTDLLAYLATYE